VSALALFPLGTVLVPTGVLPLHVFEPRYRKMMADLAGGPWSPEGSELGIVSITRGSEVGGGETRVPVGTVARLVEATALPDGRWLIVVVGTRRFRVERWLPDDPYPAAEVVEIDEAPWDPADDRLLAETERKVRRALAMATESGSSAAPVTFELDADASRASWQLTGLVPVGPLDRQALLEIAGHRDRLLSVARMADDLSQLLAARLGGAE
jgi:Lon protease-like protein